MVASLGFNFNNFVLISLLTGGRPDFLDTTLPAGTTDLLVLHLPHRVRGFGPELRPGRRHLDPDLLPRGRDFDGQHAPDAHEQSIKDRPWLSLSTVPTAGAWSRRMSPWALIAHHDLPAAGDHLDLAAPGQLRLGALIRPQISLEHWKLALGIPYQAADGAPGRAALPRAALAVELDQDRRHLGLPDRAALDHRAYAFARLQFRFRRRCPR
jgi:hypothetical protein